MITATETKLPRLLTQLPGPNAKRVLEKDAKFMSPSYTRDYPLVAKRGRGAVVEDVDGNSFLDFAAGIAVCSTGHCHPKVVAAIQKQAAELIHMSGTDFYYESLPQLAERLVATMPGAEHKKVFFREAAARYDLAKPGSLRVCPPESHVAQIRSDYRDMREMFFAEPPPFDTVMSDLRELEDRVNR